MAIFPYLCAKVMFKMEENHGRLVPQSSEVPELALFNDVCGIIDNVRGEIALYANTKICLTKWEVGRRIKEDVLFNKRAESGQQILQNLSAKLNQRYGCGWGFRTEQRWGK